MVTVAEGSGGTIDIPVAGPIKKQYVYVGVAAVAVILGYAYWRSANSGDGEIVEPGFDDYGTVEGTGSRGSTTDGLGDGDDDTAGDGDNDNMPPSTNAEWTRQGIAFMEGINYDPQLVASVLGKYLARQALTDREADIVRTVEGALGKPPVGEWRIILVGTPPPTPTPDPTPTPKPVPAAYVSVTVKKYTTANPPWQSTISGIAGHYGKSASAVWNDPKNAALKAKRKQQNLIRPGDVVYVKK